MLFDCAFLVLSQALKRINYIAKIRSDYPEVFLRKGVWKICSNFTGEHPC